MSNRIKRISGSSVGVFALLFSVCFMLFPAKAAFADAPSDKVGNLAIVSSFNPATEGVNGGHSYLVFTSYQDGLTLNFQDLYGYYEVDKNFLNEGLANADYAEHTDSKPWANDKSRAQADAAYKLTLGTQNPSDARFRSMSHAFALDANEFITIGDYSMTVDELGLSDDDALVQMIVDAVLQSSSLADLVAVSSAYWPAGMGEDEFVEGLIDALVAFFQGGNPTPDGLKVAVLGYLNGALEPGGAQVVGDYLSTVNLLTLLDGDTTGGLFVSREMWRQKAWQNLSPNRVYSIDITQIQLDSLMAFLNSGENHYGVLGHNCTSVSSGGWNAAVGFVRDAAGNNTTERSALFVDARDNTYSMLSGLFDTPKKVFEIIDAWADGLGGTKAQWPIVHGVLAPMPETYRVTYVVAGDKYGMPEDSVTPLDDTAYKAGQTVSVAANLVTKQDWALDPDSSQKVLGTWAFASWDKGDFQITENTTITGSWAFTPATPSPSPDPKNSSSTATKKASASSSSAARASTGDALPVLPLACVALASGVVALAARKGWAK